jgi:hypothetical protein
VVTIAVIRSLIALARLLLFVWQVRWLLRAYRRERDRQTPEHRSPRPRLLAAAVLVFVALASVGGVYAVKPIATGALLIAWMVEAARRRWFIGYETAA